MRNRSNILQGKVISNKMEKSITVVVERLFKHLMYGKYIKKNKKLHVHDEKKISNIGDIVKIKSSRLLSRRKSWILVKILKKNI